MPSQSFTTQRGASYELRAEGGNVTASYEHNGTSYNLGTCSAGTSLILHAHGTELSLSYSEGTVFALTQLFNRAPVSAPGGGGAAADKYIDPFDESIIAEASQIIINHPKAGYIYDVGQIVAAHQIELAALMLRGAMESLQECVVQDMSPTSAYELNCELLNCKWFGNGLLAPVQGRAWEILLTGGKAYMSEEVESE